ncbi:MAG: sensor histidine kinase [Ardenticatenaceae bacterium]|nr:sensor histidine kinase [Ardenticatenaceae bacterium]
MRLNWEQKPPRVLLLTFVVAACLKLVGLLMAMLSSTILVGDLGLARWWMAWLTTAVLLLILSPWPNRWPQRPQLAHVQLMAALAFAIFAPQLDLIQSSWAPLYANYLQELGWYAEQVQDIHALGALFAMVPVVLASWQYGRLGMIASMGLTGLLYILLPFFIPPGTFTLILYGVRGFVLLGMTFILALTVETLATAQKREQAALAQANQKLAEQAAVIEELAISQERNRLARELHDTLAHSLSATAVQLQAVQTLLKVEPEAAAAELRLAQQQIKDGLQESRRAIKALRASPLEALGLAAALRQRAAQLAERAGLVVGCQVDEPLPALPLLAEQTIYRTADEALLNAERHAQAREISLSLRHEPTGVRLVVQDDGIGFAVGVVGQNGRYGLVGMRERAALIGAHLQIESVLGQGTTVQLDVVM